MNFRTQPLLSKKERLEHERTKEYGPRPVNIFATLRTNAGLSHDELALKIRIAPHSLIRLEQGTYSRPLPTVLDYYTKLGHSELTLVDAYEDYREKQRIRHRHLFGPDLGFSVDPVIHPFRLLRDSVDYSITEVSKALCVPQSTLQRLEKKWKQQQTIPRELAAALEDLRYTHVQVANWCQWYKDWRRLNK